MIKKIIFSLILIFSLFTQSIYANNEINPITKKWFTGFTKKIDITYSISKRIKYYEGFSNKLNLLLEKKQFTEIQINLINDLIKLSNEKHFVNNKILLEKNNLTILNSSKLVSNFKLKSYNNSHIFKENGIWYTYKFSQHLKFPKGTDIRINDLDFNGINSQNTIVFLKEDNSLGFINQYEKIKLISDSIIYGIPDKFNFLKEIKNDKKKIYSETDISFQKLKEITVNLTKNKSKSEKIKSIYNYILNNIEYTNGFSLDDAKIFSGIDTFTKKDGVCEGYTKIFLYMLNFANINNIEVIRGYVIDAADFPTVGHAWVKIGDKYYDPTFDDPLGAVETKKYNEYLFYELPYNLFYTNRYSYDKIPEILKEKTIEYRKQLINNNIEKIILQYKDSGYNLLKLPLLKLKNGIEISKPLDIENFKQIINNYEVKNFSFIQNGKTRKIKTLKYYIINGNIENTIKQLNYNFDGYLLFKWILEDGKIEYRLGYDVIFQ